MKINTIAKYLLAVALFAGAVSCDNPMKDFNLQISTKVIKHSTTVRILDANGQAVAGTTVKLESGDTQNIYNLDGYKDFKVVEGQVAFGLDPNVPLSGSDAVRFRIEVKAPGYSTQVVPVTISTPSAGIVTVTLVKPTAPTEGLQEARTNVALAADGSTMAVTNVELAAAKPGEAALSLSIPAGTQFIGPDGNVIVGGVLAVTVGAFDASKDDIKALLPGGGLTADKVVLAGGRTAPGTFSAAGITNINMVINGIPVRKFTKPIAVGVPLPSDYKSPITGVGMQAGNSFDVFSNSSSDNTWKHEQVVTVTGTPAAGYKANFETDHLTFFMAAEFGEACDKGATINFSGSWMTNGSTYPVTVEATWGGSVIFKRVYSISQSTASILIDGLPDGTTLTFKNAAGTLLSTTTLATCGQVTNVQLPNPGDPSGTVATLQLYVRCPDKTTTITLLPEFDMYYRKAGSGTYAFLGTVKNGLLRTTLLKTDGTKYDFKAYYEGKVKTVNNKTVKEDNTATVGIGPGDIIGEKIGATNLAIITEACKNLK